jgi:SAM-dependent methyltransferase
MAGDYDREFTATLIGTLMRKAVWARCAARFRAGQMVLEMNCGTGEDALWLAARGTQVLATDVSSAMIEVARRKLSARSDGLPVRFELLAWEGLADFAEGPFDGMLSNFGGLNCVSDLRSAARGVSVKVRKGGVLVLCIMGPTVPWEWLWFLAQGRPGKGLRRLRKGGSDWSGIRVHYPSIGAARDAFAPEFRTLRVSALGALLPPPYTERAFGRFAGVLAGLDRVERSLETIWPLPWLADHYILELERV